MIQRSPEARGRFDKTSANAVPVVLLSPHRAEGTAVFHQHPGQTASGGDFFPGRTPVSIPEKTRGQLLLAKSRVLLNVTLFPPPASDNGERFPFEIDAWEPMELPAGIGH